MARKHRQDKKQPKSQRSTRLRLEALEDRLAPATHTWTGLASGNPNWTVASNWQSNLPPTTDGNAVLVFPSGGFQKTTTFNNFALGTTFKSIILQSSYDIKGNRLRLGSGGLSTTTGTSTFQADVEIPSGTLTISVPAGSLQLGGSVGGTISGAGGISKIGGNTLKLGRAPATRRRYNSALAAGLRSTSERAATLQTQPVASPGPPRYHPK